MDEAVTHYINSHQTGEPVHVDANGLSLNVQDEAGRVVTVMQTQGYSSQISRQVSVGEQVEGGPWNEELLDPDMRLAALVAHLAHQSRTSHHQIPSHHKVPSVRSDVDSSVILDNTSMRLFNGQALNTQSEPIVVQVPALPPLPPLQNMKRCPDTDWFNNKHKNTLKENEAMLSASEGPMMELSAGQSPAQNKQNKKSLPHKKRISRRLKRTTFSSTPQQDIIIVNCSEDVPQEEILPDNFVTSVQHPEHVSEDTHHITQEMRPIFICQLCGEYYGEEQLKFYQHLKQHYEPPAAITIDNPVSDLGIDKMTNTCIVDNSAALPDSIVELSLENTVPKTMYQTIDKQHSLYSSSDKALYSHKMLYTTASMDKEPTVPTSEADKTDLYDTLDKLGTYSCVKCNKYFRKQKHCEAHIKEAHSNSNPKLEDMGEFSEPEDLMEGIHVTVEEGSEQYDSTLLPHLTVENGTVHQEHVRHWYLRTGGAGAGAGAGPGAGAGGAVAACGAEGCCPVCPPARPPPLDTHANLKEEVLQRIFETEVPTDQNFTENIIQDEPQLPAEAEPELPPEEEPETPEVNSKKKKPKKCECPHCGRVFFHRNSLLYHLLSHDVKQHECEECGKKFYTATALRIHQRLHNGQRPYKCSECPREFRQWSDLKYHTMSLHSDQKNFKCEYCSKEFARKYSLNLHRRIHTGEKNYKCYYCTKSFRASSYRLAHMRTHTGDRPYKCSQCEKCFRVVGDLRRHNISHEKVRNRFEEQKKSKDEKTKKNTPKETVVKVEAEVKSEQKVKKIAVASTTRPPLLKNVDKKPKPAKKASIKKEGAPNVTVTHKSEQFKMNEYPAVEVFDTRPEYSKLKEVYPDHININRTIYKNNEERDMAVLRPMFREGECDTKTVYSRPENSDGKMQVFTHVEKIGSMLSIGDIRSERTDLHGEGIENGFLENLTAFYNIPAV